MSSIGNVVALTQTSPQVVRWIAEASEQTRIVAVRDIMDAGGTKLWARNQPVSRALQERLLHRRLMSPLEGCLDAADGVSAADLRHDLLRMARGNEPVAVVAADHIDALAADVQHMPLHPPIRLLLTTARLRHPQAYDHAVRGMLLAGAIAASRRVDSAQRKLALLGGLLHDIGELYVEPEYLAPDRQWDLQAMRHVAVHPRVGQLLITELTSYPSSVARAVLEHHERLDGSGYPAGTRDVSPLGQLLAVVETVLGVIENPRPSPWQRAALSLQLVAGEYARDWTGPVAHAARAEARSAVPAPATPGHDLRQRLQSISNHVEATLAEAERLANGSAAPPVRELARYAALRIALVRKAWVESGLWAHADDAIPAELGPDLEMLERELRHRMHRAWHECLWRSMDMSEGERGMLLLLGAGLVQAGGALASDSALTAVDGQRRAAS
jgi:HD domain